MIKNELKNKCILVSKKKTSFEVFVVVVDYTIPTSYCVILINFVATTTIVQLFFSRPL